MSQLPFLPYALPEIGEEEIAEVVDTLRSGWVTTGPKARRFEQEFVKFLGDDSLEAIAVNSATAGLHLALEALGIGPGDEVITPSQTWVSTANMICLLGATPVFVDVDRDTLMSDAGRIEAAITPRTRAIVPVHYAGAAFDLDPLYALAARHGIPVIEDAAHAVGTRYRDRPVGARGTAIFSFHAIKNLTCAEGGLLVTDDDDIAAQVILMSGCYMMYDQHVLRPPAEVFERWRYVTPNFSMRMSNLAAALLRPQIALLPERRQRWRRIYDDLAQAFTSVPQISLPVRDAREDFVPSSIQFSLDLSPAQIEHFLTECAARGLYIKWFGLRLPTAFTSHFGHWHYLPEQAPLPQSQRVLRQLLDLRTPLSLTPDDCRLIGQIVQVAATAAAAHPPGG